VTQETSIVEASKAPAGDLLPILDPKAAKAAYQAYLELCQAILVPYDKRIVRDGVVIQESDYARIPVRRQVGGRWITEYVDAPKKSAWRKLARFYGVSTEIMEKSKEVHKDGSFTYHYSVRASACGVNTEGEGSCTSTEKGGRSEHETRATAHTRAKSRAISDLIGFGQVSAEEYSTYEDDPPPKPVKAETHVVEPAPMAKAETSAEKPVVDTAEKTVRDTLTVNGLGTDYVLIYRYGDIVRVEPQPGFPDRWGDFNRVLRLLKAVWIDESLWWEVPAGDLEHLTDSEDEELVYDIWGVDWKLKGGEPALRDSSWAWAFAYTQDGDYVQELKPLVQYLEQYGSLETQGYTVTLGGRDKSLLQLKKNKEAKTG
jgi:hypothetical protein